MTKKKVSSGLTWPDLIPGTLVRRYKRFLADVKLSSGETVTAHCPNSGAMLECSEPGRPVYLSYHDNPKRKLKYTWEIIEMPTSLVGVNTLVPNRLVKKTIEDGQIKELSGYNKVVAEVKAGAHSRLDLLLKDGKKQDCYVEIKNCTLVNDKVARFPDAVTSRGFKHLVELQRLVTEGYRCVMFYLIQRMDAALFQPADHIDPKYGEQLRTAIAHGVKILVFDVIIDMQSIRINNKLPYELWMDKQ